MKKIFTIFLTFFMMLTMVKAECSRSEKLDLNSKAANVKTNYELVADKIDYEDGVSSIEYFVINILNITEDTYVEVSNDFYDEVKTYHYKDTENGNVRITWTDTDQIVNFTIKVYAENSTSCGGELLKTSRMATPRFNNYYYLAICNDAPDFYLCQKYVTVDEVDESEFIEKIDSFINGKVDKNGDEINPNENKKGFLEILNENKWYIVGGVAVIGAGIGIAIYLKKTKKQRELGI